MSFLFDKLFQKQNPELAGQMAKRGLVFDRNKHRWVKAPQHGPTQPQDAPKSRVKPADVEAARELHLVTENNSELYTGMFVPMVRNLIRKKKKGTYDSEKAIKLFEYLAEAGAKKYRKEFGGDVDTFTPATRKLVATQFRDDFEDEYELGNYDDDF